MWQVLHSELQRSVTTNVIASGPTAGQPNVRKLPYIGNRATTLATLPARATDGALITAVTYHPHASA